MARITSPPKQRSMLKDSESLLVQLLKAGKTPTDAAYDIQGITKYSKLKFNSLRNRAWYLAKEHGIGINTKLRASDHRKLIRLWKRELTKKGYTAVDNQHEIQRFMRKLGVPRSNPDLLAIKSNAYRQISKGMKTPGMLILPEKYRMSHIALVEIVDPAKRSSALSDQLERYMKIGRVFVVFPFSLKGVTFLRNIR